METKHTHRIRTKGGLIVACIISFSVLSATVGTDGSRSNPTTVAGSAANVTSVEVAEDSNVETTRETVNVTEVVAMEDVSSCSTEAFIEVEVPEVTAVGSLATDEEIYGTLSDDMSDLRAEQLTIAKIAKSNAFEQRAELKLQDSFLEDSFEVSRNVALSSNSDLNEAVEDYFTIFSSAEVVSTLKDMPNSIAKQEASKYPLTERADNLNLSREEVIANAILPVSNDEYEKLCKMVMAESGFCSWEMQNGCASAAVNEAIRQKTSLWDALTYPGRFVYTANFNGVRRAVTMDDINSSVYDAVNQALLGYDVNYESIGGSYGFWAPNYCSKSVNDYFYAHVRGTCMIENVCFYHDWV